MKTIHFAIVAVCAIALLSACGTPAKPTVVVEEAVTVKETSVVKGTAVVKAYGASSTQEAAEPASADLALDMIQTDRMIIKDAEMELLVRDSNAALDQVTQLAMDYGGYIISSKTQFNGDYQYADLHMAVPSSSFETVMNNLRHIAIKTLRETASGQDVSAEYADMGARLTNLEATAARVREFLDAAQTVEEALAVNETLSELEGEIEKIKGQMNYLKGRSAFSTITVYLTPDRPTPTPTLTPTPVPTLTPTPGWNPGRTFDKAADVMVSSGQDVADILIWVIVVLGPYALALAVLYWLVRVVIRRLRRARNKSSQ